jgi:hypothetical protein
MTRGLVAQALLAGAVTGGVLVSLVYTSLVRLGLTGYPEDGGLGSLIVLALIGSVAYGLGLLIVSPVWMLLHHLRFRQWWTAALLGGGLPAVVGLALTVIPNKTATSPALTLALLVPIAILSAISAVSGLVVWRIAYLSGRTIGPAWLGPWARVLVICALAGLVIWSIVYGSSLPPGP